MHLDALRESREEIHPVLSGTPLALVRLDDVDLVPHQFLEHKTVVVNGLVDLGYHGHTLKLSGQRATPLCSKDWNCGLFRRPWQRRFYLREICEIRANFSAPSQNLPAIMEKRRFCSCSTAGGRNFHPWHVYADCFDHQHRCVFCLSWPGMYHTVRFIHSRQSIRQSSFRSLKGAVEKAVFGGWVGMAKELGDESSRGQWRTQASRVVRGVLRPIFDACWTPIKSIPREKNNCAKN